MDAAQVHERVLDVLIAGTAARCDSFADLLAGLPGVGPDESAATLRRLAAASLIDPAAAGRLIPAAEPVAAPVPATATPPGEAQACVGEGSVLPVPHPLDYDWRFTRSAASSFMAHCIQLTGPGATIALLGTPTLAEAAALAPEGRRWLLLEASPATVAAFDRLTPGRVLRCDLSRDELPHLDARVVVADPPWYPDHARVFLWAAARVSQPGATILLAQPAVATRPGVLAERAGILAFARLCGLEVTAILPGVVTYSSPPFERQALAASGLAGSVPADWRRGDLIELRRTGALPHGLRPVITGEHAWHEVLLFGTRIRFRADQPEQDRTADPRLVHLVDGDVLASVSRRDPLRSAAAVWTSGNRVFGCRSPEIAAVIAAALAAGTDARHAAETHLGRRASRKEQTAIAQAARQLGDLARAETSPAPPAGAANIGDLLNYLDHGTAMPGPAGLPQQARTPEGAWKS